MEGMLTVGEKKKNMQTKDEQVEHEDEELRGVLGELPEVCIAVILSWLLPRDVAILACVCRSFRAASEYDAVWDKILPPTYRDILALKPECVREQFTSKREIFDFLCHPVKRNKQAFWIDRETGGVCLSIAARRLRITWGNDTRYWEWVPGEKSMFPKVARLKNVCWFEAKGEIEYSLPPGAYTFTWRLYLGNLRGWHAEPAYFYLSKNEVEDVECKGYIDSRHDRPVQPVGRFPLPTIRVTESGWREYDVGDFVVEKGEEICKLRFAMTCIEKRCWKSGILMDGVVVRPTKTVSRISPVTAQR